VAYIRNRAAALDAAKAYLGDGATLARSMVRKSAGSLIGHAPMRTQLTWCQKEGVPRAIITHCGSEIVENEPDILQEITAEAEQRGVEVEVAHDSMELVLR
jgi:hypothetical protein